MKRFIILSCFTALLMQMTACNFFGTNQPILEDSLQFYPSTPAQLDKASFRELYRKTSAFYDTTLNNDLFNGGFLVAKNGAIIFEKYRGITDLKSKDSIGPETAFHIASTSKTFTAMAILKLQEVGKLSINDTLQQYFNAFPYKGITIEMLLNHRSGLPNYAHFLQTEKWPIDKMVKNRDVLEVLCKAKPSLMFTTNKRFGYSNTNYVLLALLIEQVTGKSYGDYLQSIFFDPLDMKHTKVFSMSESKTFTPSFQKDGTPEPLMYLDETYGDKNIYSTPRDLLKWDQAIYAKRLFSPAILSAAFKPYSFEKPGINNYGLGWRMYLLPDDQKIVYHNGWWHGNNACFFRIESDSLTIIAIGNRYNQKIYQVKPLIESITRIRFANTEDHNP